jgi:hypothetical protein
MKLQEDSDRYFVHMLSKFFKNYFKKEADKHKQIKRNDNKNRILHLDYFFFSKFLFHGKKKNRTWRLKVM